MSVKGYRVSLGLVNVVLIGAPAGAWRMSLEGRLQSLKAEVGGKENVHHVETVLLRCQAVKYKERERMTTIRRHVCGVSEEGGDLKGGTFEEKSPEGAAGNGTQNTLGRICIPRVGGRTAPLL